MTTFNITSLFEKVSQRTYIIIALTCSVLVGTSVAIRYSLLSHTNSNRIILFNTILKPIHTAVKQQSIESITGLTILHKALDLLKRALITDQELKTTIYHHGTSFNKSLFEPSFLLLQKSCPNTITNDQEHLIEKILIHVDTICDELDTQTANNNEADLYCLALLWKQRMHDLVSLLSEDKTNNIGSLAQIWPTTQTVRKRKNSITPTKTQQQTTNNAQPKQTSNSSSSYNKTPENQSYDYKQKGHSNHDTYDSYDTNRNAPYQPYYDSTPDDMNDFFNSNETQAGKIPSDIISETGTNTEQYAYAPNSPTRRKKSSLPHVTLIDNTPSNEGEKSKKEKKAEALQDDQEANNIAMALLSATLEKSDRIKSQIEAQRKNDIKETFKQTNELRIKNRMKPLGS